jgi:uncharacterized protein (TIGR02145 family)
MMTAQKEPKSSQGRIVAIVWGIALGLAGTSCLTSGSAKDQSGPASFNSSRPIPGGKLWTTNNLNIDIAPSYCYDDVELNCRRYGRLYAWESAQRACRSLGEGWRLPTDDEWRQLAKHYGGVGQDATDGGTAAYKALLAGGSSGFNALLGGGRSHDDGQYGRVEAHGFYWTASESDSVNAVFYNFGKGRPALYRQDAGEKPRAFSVRCIRD